MSESRDQLLQLQIVSILYSLLMIIVIHYVCVRLGLLSVER